jgi:HD-GYP domain-containing protein (c-di-GMP phosphodiesterase class II)
MGIGTFSDLDNSDGRFVQIPCSDLLLGMFVAELDCSWNDTPFPIDGFHIRKVEQIEKLRVFCKLVCIDTSRGVQPKQLRKGNLTILSSARKRAPDTMDIKVRHEMYRSSRTINQEIDSVEPLYVRLGESFNTTLSNARDGNPLGLDALSRAITPVLESVIRCPDAFVWFLNRNQSENCLLKHSLRAAIWATVLTRHMGFSMEDMQEVFLGTMLADIGFAKFPESFVRKRGPFSRKEYLAYQKHVRVGVDILAVEGVTSSSILGMMRSHHERVDGNGFPRGQRGDQIPVLARIAHLAYSFDRLLKPGNGKANVSPANATSRLYKQRRIKFNEQIVYEFIQALGMYPAGSLVELSTGEFAVVLEQRPAAKLQPRMAVLSDADQNPLNKPRLINIEDDKSPDDAPTIVKAMGPASFPIDTEQLSDQLFGHRIGIGKIGIRI